MKERFKRSDDTTLVNYAECWLFITRGCVYLNHYIATTRMLFSHP
jgi:hypothetical protein